MAYKRLGLLFFAAIVGLALSGCAHETEGPSVSLNSISPNLVCSGQHIGGASEVGLSGSGFNPMPASVLADPSKLVLPSVELRQSADLFGNATTESVQLFSGDPTGSLAGNVSWDNAETLRLRVTDDPPVTLDPGVYDVTVISPDGRTRATIAGNLAVVPPPAVDALIPPTICVEQAEQTLTVEGGPFVRLNGTNLPRVILRGSDGVEHSYQAQNIQNCSQPPGLDPSFGVEFCDAFTFTIPMGSISPDDFGMTVVNPEPLGCGSTEIMVTVNPPPSVTAVSPNDVCSGGRVVTVTGQGFVEGATAELHCGADRNRIVTSVNTQPNAEGTELSVTFGPGIQTGDTCDLVVLGGACEDRPLPHQVVTSIEGPILFFSDPPVAFSSVGTRVTLMVTRLQPPFTLKMVPAGETMPETELAATQIAGSANRIQATIAAGTAAGEYDFILADSTGCPAVLSPGVTVTDQLTIQISSVSPPFGPTSDSQPVTIFRVPGNAEDNVSFTPTPRAFLNSPGGATAIQLESVTFVDENTLTAVVPENVPAGVYDLIVVDSAGNVGVLQGAYTSLATAPPVIEEVVPQSIVAPAGGTIQVRGTGFSGATVSLECVRDGMPLTPTVTTSPEACDASGCTVSAMVNAANLTSGDVCVVRVTNADGSFGEFSAIGITNSSLNLSLPRTGQPLNVGRRGLVAAAVNATTAARFVYAIGGDTGDVSNALNSVEFAPVDVFGNMSPWQALSATLTAPRTLAGGAKAGRYIYLFGGSSGGGALGTAERALVLSPRETPGIQDVDLCLIVSGATTPCFGATGLSGGLEAGTYSYRVAALVSATDPQNLGGETLASDPVIFRLSGIVGYETAVKLTWSAPVDALGAPLTGISGYRIYRTPKDGLPGAGEVLLGEVGATSLEFIDDDTAVLGTQPPLPQGSTSAWQALPALGVPREGPAGIAARDPGDPNSWYVYSLLGRDGATMHTSYEFLTVTVLPNGRQTVATAWTTGTGQVGTGRWQPGAWLVDSTVTNLAAAGPWIYVGGGVGSGAVDAAELLAGTAGQLGAFTPQDALSAGRAGFSPVAIGTQDTAKLLVFGGSAGGSPLSDAVGGTLGQMLPTIENWNAEGALSLQSPRYLPGTALQSAFIFIIGGQTDAAGAVTTSTELIVW